jgi:hypothetical protein
MVRPSRVRTVTRSGVVLVGVNGSGGEERLFGRKGNWRGVVGEVVKGMEEERARYTYCLGRCSAT